jgi:hypothetical protein
MGMSNSMKNSSLYVCALLSFVLCFMTIMFLSRFFIKNIQESEVIFSNCFEEKSLYLDKKDCIFCCQMHTEFKMELRPINRDIISFKSWKINLFLANFYGVSGPLLLLFLCPAIQLVVGICKRDDFYIMVGLSSLALLYTGITAVFIYLFATWDGS